MRNIIIIVSLLLIIIVVVLYFFLNSAIPDIKPIYKKIEIKLSNESLFIKRKVWGMNSDNQVIVISKSSKEEFDPNISEDYIYEGISTVFYKEGKDTLFIYARQQSSIPVNMKTSVKIIQVVLDNPKMMKLIEQDNYKKDNLKHIDDF